MRSLAAVLFFATSAYAHDFWIEPRRALREDTPRCEGRGGGTQTRARGDRFTVLSKANRCETHWSWPCVVAACSDSKGMVEFPKFQQGQWLVKTVHMVPAPDAAVADWESIWASLTFEVR